MKRLVIACLALLPAGCEREPTFQGKPRNYWIQELRSASSTTSMRAAHAVGHFAPEAREAIPDLIELLDAREPLVRWAAAAALGKFGPAARDAVPALRRLAAEDPEAAVRDTADSALARIAPPARPE
jgi:HEAT repeat protein